jgi:hypothetical protein
MTQALGRLVGGRAFALFLLFWLTFGALTNARTQRDYNLQQMGVDAIVAHHTFSLGHSAVPRLHPLGDVFTYNGNLLAAKQPGQFVWGTIPYAVFSALGVTYEKNYELASALVTWFSAGLFAALALALLDNMMWQFWGFSRIASLAAALSVGLASHWLCYAGIAHHDILAASLIVFALYAAERNRYRYENRHRGLAVAAGALLGLTVFTSMLPALIVAVVGIYIAATRPLRAGIWPALGFVLGLAPLLAYNAWYFGSPLMPANVAGDYSDTFFSFRPQLMARHLNDYLGAGGLSLWKYAPGLALGLVGLWLLPRRLARLRALFVAAIGIHLFYLCNIETLGTCEYGPRYLLPILALLAPGAAALMDAHGAASASPFKLLAAGALLAYGFLVNVVGALQGTIYCTLDEFALWGQIGGINHLPPNYFPLLRLAAYLTTGAAILFAWRRFVLGASVFGLGETAEADAAKLRKSGTKKAAGSRKNSGIRD